MMLKLYNPLSGYLKERFGCRVFKVSLDSGLTCPNRDGTNGRGGCTYCEPETLSVLGFKPGASIKEQMTKEIEKVRARHKAERFIAYFQVNTGTHAPLEYLEKIWREALDTPGVAGLAVSTRPDCVGEDVMGLLSALKEKLLWLELGLQSSSDDTLEHIGRGHTARDFADAVERAHIRGIQVCAHIIAGLPGEGADNVVQTARFLARLGVEGVKFHQLQVIKGTLLEKEYMEGKVSTLGLDEYARIVVECLRALPPETVIHRLSGEAPERYIVAPRWGANKFQISERILNLMDGMGSRQGDLFISDWNGAAF